MKIGITSTGKNLDAKVDPRFGRCQFFLIVDTNTMDFNCVSNESAMASGGAGIQAAQMFTKSGAEVLITGNIGPNAFQTLSAAGVKVFTGINGTVREAIDRYNKGEFKATTTPSVGSHFGMGQSGD